jgi:hypothetical protein
MSRAVQELRQIPFQHLIGAPLKASVEAQSLAAQSTVEFIHKVGFKATSTDPFAPSDLLFDDPSTDADAGELRNVTFRYSKKSENDAETTDFSLTVPLLAIVPIPSLRIDEVTIDFSAKLTDAIRRDTRTTTSASVSTSGKYSSFWSPVKLEFRASASRSTTATSALASTREYKMDIHVRAVQDEMPGGLSKMLDILEEAIEDKPATGTP